MRKDQSGHLIMSIVSMGQLWSESAPHCESQQNNGERPLWPAHQHHCPQKNPPACEHVSDLMLQESPLTLRGICNCVSFTEEQKSTGTLLPRVHTLVAPQEWGKCVHMLYFQLKANPETSIWVEGVDLRGDSKEHRQGVERKAKTECADRQLLLWKLRLDPAEDIWMHPELLLSRGKASGISSNQLVSTIGQGLLQLPGTSTFGLCIGSADSHSQKRLWGRELQVLAELLVCKWIREPGIHRKRHDSVCHMFLPSHPPFLPSFLPSILLVKNSY